jgi:hypothetical protein
VAKSFVVDYNLQVYPNPSRGIFNLSMDADAVTDLELKVFNLSGALIYTEKISNLRGKLRQEVDLSDFGAGLYQLQLKTNRRIYNRPIVIQ